MSGGMRSRSETGGWCGRTEAKPEEPRSRGLRPKGLALTAMGPPAPLTEQLRQPKAGRLQHE